MIGTAFCPPAPHLVSKTRQPQLSPRQQGRPGDPPRVRELLVLAKRHANRRQWDKARRYYRTAAEEAARQPDKNALNLMSALLGWAQIEHVQGKRVDELVARMLAAASRLPADQVHEVKQAQVAAYVLAWQPMVIRAVSNRTADRSAEEVERQLSGELTAFETRLKKHQVNPALVRLGRLSLAKLQHARGAFDDTLATLDQLSPQIEQEQVWEEFRAIYWNLHGLVATERNNFARAYLCYSRALELRRDAPNVHPDQVAESWNNLGLLMLRLGDYAAAETFLDRAKAAYGERWSARDVETPFGALFTRLNLAKVADRNSKFDEGLRRLNELGTLLASLDPENRDPQTVSALRSAHANNLALAYYNLGRFEDCEQQFQRARSLAVQSYSDSHIRVAELDVNLGWAALRRGQLEDAESRFRRALDALRQHYPERVDRITEVQGYLARSLLLQKRPAEARQMLEQAVSKRTGYLHRTLYSALSQRDRLAFVQELRVHGESIDWPGTFDTLLETGSSLRIEARQQYRWVLDWKGALSGIGVVRGDRSNEARAVQRLIRTRESTLRELRSLAGMKHQEPKLPAEVGRRIEQLQREAGELERRIRRDAKSAGLQNERRISPADVAAALPSGAVLLDVVQIRRLRDRRAGEPVREDRFYVAFLVWPTGDVKRIELGSANRIDDDVRAFSRSLHASTPDMAAARRLGAMFNTNVARHLDDEKLLLVAGDGLLQQLPFAALPGQQEKYLIEELAVAKVATAQSLVLRRRRPTVPPANWLVVGGVDYGQATNSAWGRKVFRPLGGAAREAEQIDALLRQRFPNAPATTNGDGLLQGKSATGSQVRRRLSERTHLHLATHGLFLAAYNPDGSLRSRGQTPLLAPKTNVPEAFGVFDVASELDSAIVLAGVNAAPPGDLEPILTAEELGGRDLSHLELVVLSACETGLGYVQTGQGLVGLLGALDRAGARSVVSSLWRVDDVATETLMKHFYTGFLDEQTPLAAAEALRQAQLKMLTRTDKLRQPYYWAAWTISGDPWLVVRDGPRE